MAGAEPSSSSAGNGQHAAVDIRVAAAAAPEEPRQTSMSGPLNLRSDRRPPPAAEGLQPAGVPGQRRDGDGHGQRREERRRQARAARAPAQRQEPRGAQPQRRPRPGRRRAQERRLQHVPDQVHARQAELHAAVEDQGGARQRRPGPRRGPARRQACRRGPSQQERPRRPLLRRPPRPRARRSPRLRGHPAAQGRGVAVPAAVPDRLLRRLPGARQPGHPVGRAGGEPGDGVPPRDAHDQRRRVAAGDGGARGHLRHLRAQVRLLLRGDPARVLPPGARQLLLHAVHRRHVPRHRPAPRLRAGEAAPGRLVRVRGAALRAGAQDLRAVAVGRQAAAVQGGQPVVAPVRGGQLRGRHPGGEGRVGGGRQVPLGHRRLPLHRRLRHALPAPAHQRGAAHGAAPGLLHVHRHALRRRPRLGRHLRQLRRRRAHLLLHGALPLHVTRRAHQLLPWLPVLHRMVVLHVSHDDGVAGHRQVRRGRAVLHEQSPRAEPVPHVDDHGVAAARVDAPARLLLAVALPQRPGHRHHQGPAGRRGEAARQGEEGRQEGERHQAVGQAGAALGRLLHHQDQLCRQGGRGENRLVVYILYSSIYVIKQHYRIPWLDRHK
uniref:Predicted protein n=1 Tax=Hordeum vulgare subsp. vulgare TaxID=112509 RepID=F2CSB3_HORVV|nr:predicted protein [Hordeum vulgare subsp. vulgare]